MAPQAYVLADMTSPEFKEALRTVEAAIIPTGANEQHGPHLALNTDIANAYAMALRIAERLHPRVVVVPPLPFGISPHHMAFPGTITLRPPTFLAVLEDVMSSMKEHGLRNFFVINGHGGNLPSLEQQTLTARRDLGVNLAFAKIWPSRDVMAKYAATESFGHACDMEVSWSLYLVPAIVRKDKLARGAYKRPLYRHTGTVVTIDKDITKRSDNGALGDATKASAETGKALIDPIVQACVEFLEDFMKYNRRQN